MSEERPESTNKGWKAILDVARTVWVTPGRRRTVVRLAAAVVVLALVAIVPGYLALQPKFQGGYADAHYQSWSTSVHAQVPCQRCHVAPTLLAQASFGVQMVGEFYVSLLPGRKMEFGKPDNAACSSCHIDLRTVSPSGDLKIPHRAHVNVLGIDCVKCHNYLVHEKSPEGKHKPRMVTCMTCHDGKQAKNTCTACHTDKAVPATHREADWLVRHPQQQKDPACEKCHGWTEKWCVECHTRRPASHGDKWRSEHRNQVEVRRNCEACHKGAFCVRCHGEVPKKNFKPALKLVK